MYQCQACGLEVKEIPKYRKGECPEDIQHYFRPVRKEIKEESKLELKLNKEIKWNIKHTLH